MTFYFLYYFIKYLILKEKLMFSSSYSSFTRIHLNGFPKHARKIDKNGFSTILVSIK